MEENLCNDKHGSIVDQKFQQAGGEFVDTGHGNSYSLQNPVNQVASDGNSVTAEEGEAIYTDENDEYTTYSEEDDQNETAEATPQNIKEG